MRRFVFVLLACFLVPASGAWGSTAQVSGNMLVYTAGAGENNTISFEPAFFDAGAVSIQDSVPLTPGPGCSAVSDTKVDCQRSGLTTARFVLGDGPDDFAPTMRPRTCCSAAQETTSSSAAIGPTCSPVTRAMTTSRASLGPTT